MVGTVSWLMFNVLVDVALLNEVMVPDAVILTIPPALFVIPVTVKVPFKFNVSVLVKLANTVVTDPDPVIFVVPALEYVPIEHAAPILTEHKLLLLNPPVPASAVPTVKFPLFVKVIVVTVILGMLILFPLKACALV